MLGALRDDTTPAPSLGATTQLGAYGILGALRNDDTTQDQSLGAQQLNKDMLEGLGTKGRASGDSVYGSDATDIGAKGEGGIGTVSGQPIVLGALDKSLIDAVIANHMADLRYAYERELKDNPTLQGKITIKFVIARDGNVSSAFTKNVEMNLPEVGDRVAKAMCQRIMDFQFPEPRGGGFVIVNYPFEFLPD